MTDLVKTGSIYFFSRKKNNKKDKEENTMIDEENLICRFVLDGAGKKIGESVAIDKDIMIIKNGNKYLGIPLKHIEEEGKTLLVKGLVNRDKAEKLGETWRNDSFNIVKTDLGD